MSQSSKTLREFGALSVKADLRLKTGSTTALGPAVTPAPTTLADADALLTVAQLRSGIVVQTPTADRNVTLPTAALMAGFLKSVGDSYDFYFINLGGDTFHSTLVPGTGGSVVGLAEVKDNNSTAESASGSAKFRVRQTNVGAGTQAYVVYRLA